MKATTIGIDLVKTVLQIHGVDGHGKLVLRKRLDRSKMLEFFVRLPSCLIEMGACGSAHYCARKLKAMGHTVKLMAPQFPNVSLLSLPAGSPELDPAEQVWQQLHERSLGNRCYGSYEDIVDGCCVVWNKFTQVPDAIRSLCTRSLACLAPALTKT